MSHPYGEVSEEGENQKRQEGKIKTFQSKVNVVQRLLLDKPVFSNRGNGFCFLIKKCAMAPPNCNMAHLNMIREGIIIEVGDNG